MIVTTRSGVPAGELVANGRSSPPSSALRDRNSVGQVPSTPRRRPVGEAATLSSRTTPDEEGLHPTGRVAKGIGTECAPSEGVVSRGTGVKRRCPS